MLYQVETLVASILGEHFLSFLASFAGNHNS